MNCYDYQLIVSVVFQAKMIEKCKCEGFSSLYLSCCQPKCSRVVKESK